MSSAEDIHKQLCRREISEEDLKGFSESDRFTRGRWLRAHRHLPPWNHRADRRGRLPDHPRQARGQNCGPHPRWRSQDSSRNLPRGHHRRPFQHEGHLRQQKLKQLLESQIVNSRAIVQVHLTRRCNPRCQHCYSESGRASSRPSSCPGSWTSSLGRNPKDIASWRCPGRTLSVSFLEGSFDFSTRIRLGDFDGDERHTSRAPGSPGVSAPYVNLFGVSFDGAPTRHNELRRHPTAFARAEKGLAVLRDHERPFLILHTLTRETVDELDWLLDLRSAAEPSAFACIPSSSRVSGLPWPPRRCCRPRRRSPICGSLTGGNECRLVFAWRSTW